MRYGTEIPIGGEQGQVVAQGSHGNQGVHRRQLEALPPQTDLKISRLGGIGGVWHIAQKLRRKLCLHRAVLDTSRRRADTIEGFGEHGDIDGKRIARIKRGKHALPQRMVQGHQR